jgi:hypothetical protein
MKKLLYALFLCSLPFSIFAQQDYYIKDTSQIDGVELINNGPYQNQKQCQIKHGKDVISYSPDQIKEYGFQDGNVYTSFTVVGKDSTYRYFFESIVDGKSNMYCLRRKKSEPLLYITVNDSNKIVEIPKTKTEIKALLKTLPVDSFYPVQIPELSYNYYSLKRFITLYNENKTYCFPSSHYGFIIGRTSSEYSGSSNNSIYYVPNFNRKWNFTIGAFYDLPIYSTAFSLHLELYYKRNNLALTSEVVQKNGYALILNNASFSVPILIRYTLLKKDNSPFFEGGPVLSKTIFNKNALYSYKTDSNITVIDKPIHSSIFYKMNAGVSLGLGVISHINAKYAIVSELRYTSFIRNSTIINVDELSFNFGIEF